jgi:hypothetical protein
MAETPHPFDVTMRFDEPKSEPSIPLADLRLYVAYLDGEIARYSNPAHEKELERILPDAVLGMIAIKVAFQAAKTELLRRFPQVAEAKTEGVSNGRI